MQVDNDLLPDCCIVCGQHTVERVNKDFWYQSDWAGLLTLVGCLFFLIPGLIIASLTTQRIRVACPICRTHRDAERRLIWIASTGWLAAPALGLVGFGVAYPFVELKLPGVLVAPLVGVVIGLVAYFVLVIRLYLRTVHTVDVEWMTSEYVRFRGVSAAFAREAAQMSGAPQSDSAITGQHPHSPSAIRTAWDEWWAERDRWNTNSAQVVLAIVILACLIAFLSYGTRSQQPPGTQGQRIRQTIVEIGVPFSPWFRYEANAEGRPGFKWEINFISWSTAIMLAGGSAWYANWQIEKAKAKASGKELGWWHGSPELGFAIWGVATLCVLGVALLELPDRQMPDRHAAEEKASSAPPKQQAEPSDEVAIAPSQQGWILTPDGPMLTDVFARMSPELDPAQTDEVNRILQAAYAEYLKIEVQYLEQEKVDHRHVIVTIKPHPDAVAKLEDRLWTQLDGILDADQQKTARSMLMLDPPDHAPGRRLADLVGPGFFGWGKEGAEIEIWRVGRWYHWKVRTRGREFDTEEYNLGGPELPEWLRRFWKEPHGQATSLKSDG